MTDKEIIKALECCIKPTSDCDNCPYYRYDDDLQCFDMSKRDALDLINRQQAEIEKLNVELVGMRGACNSYKMHYDNAKAEIERLQRLFEQEEKSKNSLTKKCYKDGIKEFAEILKEFMHTKFKDLDAYEFKYVTENDIDNLVKEMVGEQE